MKALLARPPLLAGGARGGPARRRRRGRRSAGRAAGDRRRGRDAGRHRAAGGQAGADHRRPHPRAPRPGALPVEPLDAGRWGSRSPTVARALGAKVTVVLGPAPSGRTTTSRWCDVVSAEQMLEAVLQRVERADFFVAAAAVSDWRPADGRAEQKVKKGEAEGHADAACARPTCSLEASQQGARAARSGRCWWASPPRRSDVLAHAKQKLESQAARLHRRQRRVAAGRGLRADTNRVQIVSRSGAVVDAAGREARSGAAKDSRDAVAKRKAMSDDAASDSHNELRKHLAWQESDGSKSILGPVGTTKPAAASQKAPAPPVREDSTIRPLTRPSGPPSPEGRGITQTLDEVRTRAGRLPALQAVQRAAPTSSSGWATRAPSWSSWARGRATDEDTQGVPFVGKAGQLLTKMIEAMSFSRDDVYICNVVKCRPPEQPQPRARRDRRLRAVPARRSCGRSSRR